MFARLLTIKGAPDVLISRCASVLGADGMSQPLTTEIRREIEAVKDSWSALGKRVILLARKVLPANTLRAEPEHGTFEDETMDHARTGLTLVGLIGIVDPPRDEIPEVVKILRRAGIRIFMVTGDFKLTAQAIAVECGIITNPPALIDNVSALSRDFKNPTADEKANLDVLRLSEREGVIKAIVLSGHELITLNDGQWSQLCSYDEVVFARTTPEQKLRIVKEFQSRDNIVGMTGDGKWRAERSTVKQILTNPQV
jgi:sodium/potassium-transporting ATPase subunit alpha